MNEKMTVNDLLSMKKEGRTISAVTAYDYPSALIADKAGIDVILVGDSLGMVVLGYESTTQVTLEEILHHCKPVARAVRRALVVGDMPFMSYNVSKEEAVGNAGKLIKEGHCHAIKLEGGRDMAGTISAIVKAGIPTIGHVGMLPQTAPMWNGYRVQGRTADSARKIINDAHAIEESGASAVVLEMVTTEVAKMVTEEIGIPTIGIGSGSNCDGQILVLHDMLGLYERFTPKFVKKYVDLGKEMLSALSNYGNEVVSGRYPEDQHSFHMDEAEYRKLCDPISRFHKAVSK